MPDRIIRDELLTSERYWSVGIEAQQLFTHLLLRADALGRFSGKNFTIRMSCYPGLQRTPLIIEKMLAELHDADLIRLYEAAGERFVFIPRYRQRLRYTNSKYPAPPNEINDIIEEKSGASQTTVRPAPPEEKRREEVPFRTPRKTRAAPDEGLVLRREVWTAYESAYQDRYGVPPADNVESRSAIKKFCGKIQAVDCVAVAAFYLTHNGAFYVAKGHNPLHLAADAAKLRTEWATGRQITQTEAQQGDRRQGNRGVFQKIIKEIEDEKTND